MPLPQRRLAPRSRTPRRPAPAGDRQERVAAAQRAVRPRHGLSRRRLGCARRAADGVGPQRGRGLDPGRGRRPCRAGPVGSARAYLTLQGSAQDLPVAATGAAPAAPASASRHAPKRLFAATGLTGKLVFQESSGGKIDVYDLATGELRPLTTGADPAVSPDGRTVAFWRETAASTAST